MAISLLGACAGPPLSGPAISARVQALLPADAILLGEQHDNPDHQRIQQDLVAALVARGQLSAVVLEMAERPHSTAGLAPMAPETQVRAALRWNETAWPWQRYAPVVMAAVRAGVPVHGANLQRAQMREAMGNVLLDSRLDATALVAQNQAIREGHCNMLPEAQIAPMTRIQIGRDVAMAETLKSAVAQAQGKTVLLIAGSGHVDKALGIPRHLPVGKVAKSVLLAAPKHDADATATGKFDAVWPSLAVPPKDYCAEFKASRGG